MDGIITGLVLYDSRESSLCTKNACVSSLSALDWAWHDQSSQALDTATSLCGWNVTWDCELKQAVSPTLTHARIFYPGGRNEMRMLCASVWPMTYKRKWYVCMWDQHEGAVYDTRVPVFCLTRLAPDVGGAGSLIPRVSVTHRRTSPLACSVLWYK